MNSSVWGAQQEVEGWRKGPWTAEEDRLLAGYVRLHGEGRWNSVSRLTGTTAVTVGSTHTVMTGAYESVDEALACS
ncbi:hypothetical protein SAY86_025519 [Trapa natans]|uniref:Uncharacterized protein n=1 Tax=Trapa natans TaxID=22666 RepID=A0AAN7M797_TRANT|nr:hypothetical protein SAY86_025519 [Trapa natans]